MAQIKLNATYGMTGTLPAVSGANLTSLTSGNLTGALPAISGASLTGISAGKLAQIVETNYTTYAGNSTNTLNTNMSRTITPSATDSKIYVSLTAQMSKEAANTKVIGKIFRSVGGSVVATRVCTDNMHWDGGTYGKRQATMAIQWLDSPSTTAEITYQFAWSSYDNSNQVHINNYNAGGSFASQITCWEVLA